MLGLLGRIGKGWGTISGAAILLSGLVLDAEGVQTVVGVSEAVPYLLQGIGSILMSFGIGRKAGVELQRAR